MTIYGSLDALEMSELLDFDLRNMEVEVPKSGSVRLLWQHPIRQPVAEMARAATEMLVEQVRTRPGECQLDYTLIRRASDSAPKAGGWL
jgi:hypothetical protein